MVDDSSLLYRPDLTVVKDYAWDGLVPVVATPSTTTATPPSTTTATPPVISADTIEKAALIHQSTQVLKELSLSWFPEALSEPIASVMDEIDNTIEVWSAAPVLVQPDPEIIAEIMPSITPTNWSPDTLISPEVLAAIRLGDLVTLTPDTVEYPVAVNSWPSLGDAVRNVLAEEMKGVKDLFLSSLRSLMLAHMAELITLRQEVGFAKLEDILKNFDGDAVKVTDPKLFPLRDSIIRSQVERNQVTRLFQKTHGVDHTVFHMRQILATNEQWARCYDQEPVLGNTMVNAAANEQLLAAREQYQERYQQSMFGFSKYLNGAMPILGNIMGALCSEAKSKAKLLQSGVNIYETTDTASLSSNTTSTATDVTKTPAAGTTITATVATPATGTVVATTPAVVATPAATEVTATDTTVQDNSSTAVTPAVRVVPTNTASLLPATPSYRPGGSLT